MALYGGARDISLFRHINRELLHNIIDTEVLFYKVNLDSTVVNIYEEAEVRIYDQPIQMHALVDLPDREWSVDDYNPDLAQTGIFAFLRDDLVDNNMFPETGDIIEYRSAFYEIDSVSNDQVTVGKDPDNWLGGDEFGWNVSIKCNVHMTRQSNLNLVETRFGNNPGSSNRRNPTNV